MLFSHISLGVTSGIYLSGFPTKIMYAFLFSPTRVKFPPSASSFSWSL